MKKLLAWGVLMLAAVWVLAADGNGPPPWAYPVAPAAQPAKDDGIPRHVPNSTQAYTLSQIRRLYDVPDWHPDEHPSLPDVVAHGRDPGVRPCGYCHLPNGEGRPENASLAGLPASYIERQVRDFRSGVRKSSDPNMGPPLNMILIAQKVSDDDVKTAAAYFSALPLKPWIKVVEADTVPKTRVAGGMLVPAGEGSEPIGDRIIEVPDDVTRTELRDSQSGFIAYVPRGSIEKGKVLVTTGGATVAGGKIVPGKTTQCSVCHGPDLRGLGSVPRLAGRSPSYLVRQLYDIQHGNRAGEWDALMKGVVTNLSENDIVSIVAYLSSLKP